MAPDVLADLRAAIGGAAIGPRDARYDRCRAVFDQRVDRRPAAIARCASAADVRSALEVATAHGLPVAVRGGATTGAATVDGGVVVDLSAMRAVEVDADARVARVGGGATWALLDAATQEHGLAVTGARVSRLGVAGVALGSGSGWLERHLGPTGRHLRRVAWERGAGVEVATELELELHPLGPEIVAGFLAFPRDRAAEIARAFRDQLAAAPGETGGGLVLTAGRGGGCTIAFCHAGPPAEGERAVAPLRALGPSLDAVGPNEYVAFQAMTDLQHPFGMRAHRCAGELAELSGAALDALLEAAGRPASALSRVLVLPRGGALGEGPAWAWDCLGLWPPVPALDAGNVAWVEAVAAALEPYAPPAPGPALRRLGRTRS